MKIISLPFTIALSAIFMVTPLNASDQPKFEAASVKPANRCSAQNLMDPGRVTLNGDPLNVVIKEAFQVQRLDQIIGPSWLETDCFTIVAKIPEGATKDQLPAMFQSLLAERFKLAVHKESRLRSGYALALYKNGPKFKESDPNSPYTKTHAGQVHFAFAGAQVGLIKGSMSMAALAHHVSVRLGAPVQDLTGLKGKYDIDVSWVPDRTIEKIGQVAENSAVPPSGGSPDGLSTAAPGDILLPSGTR